MGFTSIFRYTPCYAILAPLFYILDAPMGSAWAVMSALRHASPSELR